MSSLDFSFYRLKCKKQNAIFDLGLSLYIFLKQLKRKYKELITYITKVVKFLAEERLKENI